MRKTIRRAAALLLCTALLLGVPACRSAESTGAPASSDTESSTESAAYDKTVTLSEDVLKITGVDPAALARKLGSIKAEENKDGSYAISMSKETYESACESLKASLNEQLAAFPESGTWPFLDTVELSGRTVRLFSEAERYSPVRDNTVAQAVYIPALLCAAFTGEDTENYTLHFIVLDRDGKTELGTFDYPIPEPSPSPSPKA